MPAALDAYIRVSKLGERSEDESTEVYEAIVREWARQSGARIGVVVDDTNVSGSVAVADRGLERLVRRVEDGESAGIVTPYIDRFGRDLIEGAVALKRVHEAGGRVVAPRDGFDSRSPGSQLTFNLRMAIAQDFLERNRANWQAAVRKAVDRGAFLGAHPPFGYGWDEHHRLFVDEVQAGIVVELFVWRAARENYGALHRWFRARCAEAGIERGARMSKSGVRAMVRNRVYLGEMRVQGERRGEPRVIVGAHPPVLTPEQWEAAQFTGEFVPRTGNASTAALRGMVYCAGCGRRLKAGTGRRRKGVPQVTYTCTTEDCGERAAIRARLLDDYVEGLVQDAALAGEPHVVAVIEGDTRYEDAMAGVERARTTYEEFRDSAEMQETLGMDGFARGLRVRRDALDAARDALAAVPAPEARRPTVPPRGPEGAELAARGQALARFVDRVVLRSAGGRRPPAGERADVYLTGSAEPYRP